jgi:hypothetical protein
MPNRVTTADRLAVIPAPIAAAATPGYNGPLTEISYEQINGLQEAFCVPLEDGGVTLDKDNYTQFATLLSGVHGIVSNVRGGFDSFTVASTHAKKVLLAATNCTASGNGSVVCGAENISLGTNCLAFGEKCGQGGVGSIVGGYHVSSTGSGAALFGREAELVDSHVLAIGYSAAPIIPAGAANQGIAHYLNAQTGEARHKGTVNIGGNVDAGTGATIVLDGATGDVTVSGEIKGAGTDPLAIGSAVEMLVDTSATGTVDWATAAAEIEAALVAIIVTDVPFVEIALTLSNSDSSTHDIEMGSSILLDIASINPTRTLIGATAETLTGSTNAEKGLRWACGMMRDSAGDPFLAVTSVGKTTATIAASGADTVTIKVRLQYAKLTTA